MLRASRSGRRACDLPATRIWCVASHSCAHDCSRAAQRFCRFADRATTLCCASFAQSIPRKLCPRVRLELAWSGEEDARIEARSSSQGEQHGTRKHLRCTRRTGLARADPAGPVDGARGSGADEPRQGRPAAARDRGARGICGDRGRVDQDRRSTLDARRSWRVCALTAARLQRGGSVYAELAAPRALSCLPGRSKPRGAGPALARARHRTSLRVP
jgi:hypothetical protein